MTPGPLRNAFYWIRLAQGLAMTAAGGNWLVRLAWTPKRAPVEIAEMEDVAEGSLA